MLAYAIIGPALTLSPPALGLKLFAILAGSALVGFTVRRIAGLTAIERQMEKAGNIGSEFERMAKTGSVAPDLWMKKATGSPVGPEALLTAAAEAVPRVEAAKD